MKEVLRGKFIVIQAYLKRIETLQINNLTLHLQELEEQQQSQPRASTKKEITKIRPDLNDIETKRKILRINESRSWFLEKINKVDKPLSMLIKKKRERIQINTIRNERGETTTNTTEIQRIVRNYYEELYAKKCENLGEMDKFLEKYNLPKLNEEAEESLNRTITPDEIETVIKKLLMHKGPGPEGFTGEFYKAFKAKLTSILQKIQEDGRLPNPFYEASSIVIPQPDKDTTKKENFRSVLLMNIDGKILNKTLANCIQQCVKNIVHHDQEGFTPGCKDGTIFTINKHNTPHKQKQRQKPHDHINRCRKSI